MAALRKRLAPSGQPPVSLQAVQQRRARLQAKVPMASAITVKEVHLDRVKVPDTALSARRLGEAKRMGAVYPILYAFENSVREFVDGHLTEAFGKGWWSDSKIVGRGIRQTVERNQAAEGQHRYHS